MTMRRRDFFRSSLAASTLVALGGPTIPAFLGRSARASSTGRPGDRILVVVQLIGGNDGLNTVVPFGQDGYGRARKALRLPSGKIHRLADGVGLHPAMRELARLVEAGRGSIVQGVGYPNPDRSHFRSMEVWESARLAAGATETGWLGRALDARPGEPGADSPGLHVGVGSPLALASRRTEVPSLTTLEQYRLQVGGDVASRREVREALERVARLDRPGDDPLLGFVRRSTVAAYESSRKLEALDHADDRPAKYPDYGLARRLALVARIIKAGFGTRIYYTTLDGFDTHANQLGTHAALLKELSDSLAAFHRDLDESGEVDRVAVLAFSEFGRRVAENGSGGTDHGAAAPVFVLGPVARPGLVGDHPSLDDLDDGDLKHRTDFRRVYASLLEEWLGMPAAPLVGDGFAGIGLFAGGSIAKGL